MKKKEYMKPAVDIIELDYEGILMTSGDTPEQEMPVGDDWPSGIPTPW